MFVVMAAIRPVLMVVLAQKGCDLHKNLRLAIYELKDSFAENWKIVQPVREFNIKPAEANAQNWHRKKHCYSFQKFNQSA
jgi:hypothetical protein